MLAGSVKKKFLLANKHITKCVYLLICGAEFLSDKLETGLIQR